MGEALLKQMAHVVAAMVACHWQPGCWRWDVIVEENWNRVRDCVFWMVELREQLMKQVPVRGQIEE